MIGGSFALAARRAGIADRITGWDAKSVLDEACARGVIDSAEEAFGAGAVCSADLVYLAAPVGAIAGFLRTRASSLKAGAIVTDAGSTKREICRVANEALSSEVHFVGGHPMAGSEQTGVEFADANLFGGATYALIADDKSVSKAVSVVGEVVRDIGAIPITLTAEIHDRVAARVSHTPQMVSTALALMVARTVEPEKLLLAGSGFAEMTRLAESRWSIWEDICRTNADEIGAGMDEMISEMETVRAAVSTGDLSQLGEMFEAAADIMRRLHDQRKRRVDQDN